LKKDCQKLTAWKQKESARITALDLRQKALRGESHEHFRHEIRPEAAKGHERHDGNQTMQVFPGSPCKGCFLKPFTAQVL
jgi:hypothetical protein